MCKHTGLPVHVPATASHCRGATVQLGVVLPGGLLLCNEGTLAPPQRQLNGQCIPMAEVAGTTASCLCPEDQFSPTKDTEWSPSAFWSLMSILPQPTDVLTTTDVADSH